MAEHYEVLEPVKHTEAAGGNDGEQQWAVAGLPNFILGEQMENRLGLLQKGIGEQMGSHSAKEEWSGLDGEKREKVIQAVGAAEAVMRWQNKPVCHGEHHRLIDGLGGDM